MTDKPVSPPAQKPWPGLRWGWADAEPDPRKLERRYTRQLMSVAGRIRAVVTGKATPESKIELLRTYAEAIKPWAEATATNLLTAIDRQNAQAWRVRAAKMSAGMREVMERAAANQASPRQMIQANIALIRDLPDGAAARLQDLVVEASRSGMRPETLAKRIAETAPMAESRARTIARTEVAKADTAINRSRAQSVGSEGYIWRTARDGDVRDSHARMEGRFVRWDDPPFLDGYAGHAGEFVNCRCYTEVVLPQALGGGTGSSLPAAGEVEAAPESRSLISRWERESKEIVPIKAGQVLPNVEQLQIDRRKLTEYALDPNHPRGGHKARVLMSALGMDASHAADLEAQIMAHMPNLPTRARHDTNEYGERAEVVVPVTGPNGQTVDVRTGWIYDRDGRDQSMKPRLTSLRVAKKQRP